MNPYPSAKLLLSSSSGGTRSFDLISNRLHIRFATSLYQPIPVSLRDLSEQVLRLGQTSLRRRFLSSHKIIDFLTQTAGMIYPLQALVINSPPKTIFLGGVFKAWKQKTINTGPESLGGRFSSFSF